MNKNICIYCASSDSVDEKFFKVANELGSKMVLNGYGLVYGGAKVGLMGEIAKTVYSLNGKIIGVIPEKIRDKGLAFEHTTELIVTKNMRDRKALMESNSDAFIALPGGFGTLEEISEMIVAKQLHYHNKPLIFLNVDNFYTSLFDFFDNCCETGFAKEESRDLYHVATDIDSVFSYLQNYKEHEIVSKW
jgi:hypothetical protein